MLNNIKVLDCTLRDGGQGLTDINTNIESVDIFTESEKSNIAQLLANSGIDIVEIGCVKETDAKDESGFALYSSLSEVSKHKPKKMKSDQLISALFIGPDICIDSIPCYSEDMVDCVRVILRYSELKKSLDFCRELIKKGYKTCVQPMLTMRYTDDEIKYVLSESNDMGAYAVYFVDSFGYMSPSDVKRLYSIYDQYLNKSIKIGFHAHNNMQMAFENVKEFLSLAKERDVIVDSCAYGMGQGAGNMQTELLVPYLNKEFSTNYDLDSVLDICDVLEKYKLGDMKSWGYSPLRLIPALYNTAYKYATSLKVDHNKSLREINNIIKNMPNDMRHRYTKDNLDNLLNKHS